MASWATVYADVGAAVAAAAATREAAWATTDLLRVALMTRVVRLTRRL